LCAFFLGYITLANLRAMDVRDRPEWLPKPWRWIGHHLWLVLNWRLLALRSPSEHGWPILAAKLADGREVDLFRQGALVDFRKPKEYVEGQPLA